MPYVEPPNGYTSAAKAYAKRQYQGLAQDINNAQAGRVVSRMPPQPTKGVYYFTNAIPGDPIITKAGTYAFNGSTWIGNMDEQTWPSARISNLTFDKIDSGTNTDAEIVLSTASAKIRSNNYVAGSSGFVIKGDGSAEFQNVTVRGTLNANDLYAGTIAEARFGTDSISAVPIKPGVLHYQAGLVSDLSLPNNSSASIVSGSYASGAVNVPANNERSGVAIILSISNFTVAGTADACNLAGGGHIIGQIARGSTTGLINGSQAFLQLAPYYNSGSPAFTVNQSTGTATGFWYESVGAIGKAALNYYLRAHQYIHSSGNVNCRVGWLLMEFSKS